jgi:hypothetical protein
MYCLTTKLDNKCGIILEKIKHRIFRYKGEKIDEKSCNS